MTSAEDANDTLNSLLRGELAAVETYNQALAKFGDAPHSSELKLLKAEHDQAVNILRQHLARRGAMVSEKSGVWGMWAKMIEGAAQLFGKTAALKALKEGEEHGVRDYEEALEDENLDPETRVLIHSNLLPQTRAHIPVLDRLM